MSTGCDDGGDGDVDGGGLEEETHGCSEEKQVLVIYFIYPW